ncbi:MAG: hypothetical protein BWX98_02564 [Candidatus Aminicenantes bacterium ADurb.Bin147]|nr:MAG: hypothetical protein BWX98_02564 [Candidatus Aminicenantes bacterium ADurb.Bin147]
MGQSGGHERRPSGGEQGGVAGVSGFRMGNNFDSAPRIKIFRLEIEGDPFGGDLPSPRNRPGGLGGRPVRRQETGVGPVIDGRRLQEPHSAFRLAPDPGAVLQPERLQNPTLIVKKHHLPRVQGGLAPGFAEDVDPGSVLHGTIARPAFGSVRNEHHRPGLHPLPPALEENQLVIRGRSFARFRLGRDGGRDRPFVRLPFHVSVEIKQPELGLVGELGEENVVAAAPAPAVGDADVAADFPRPRLPGVGHRFPGDDHRDGIVVPGRDDQGDSPGKNKIFIRHVVGGPAAVAPEPPALENRGNIGDHDVPVFVIGEGGAFHGEVVETDFHAAPEHKAGPIRVVDHFLRERRELQLPVAGAAFDPDPSGLFALRPLEVIEPAGIRKIPGGLDIQNISSSRVFHEMDVFLDVHFLLGERPRLGPNGRRTVGPAA